MAKVSFASLKLKVKDEVKTINIGDKVIEVKQYLPAEDKNSILENVIQNATTETILNTFAIDALFHLYIIFKYTNLSFTDAQKSDLLKLYDILESNGIIDLVVTNMNEAEYTTLVKNLEEMIESYESYRKSAKGLVDTFITFAPESANILAEELKNLDTGKFQQVIDLAAATGAYNKPQ